MAGFGPGSAQDVRTWRELDNEPSIIALEYIKHGDLYGLIEKAATAGVEVPDEIIWKIFFCCKF